MSKSKLMKMSRDGISPNMMLLHLRWQQIRLELLQQAANSPQSETLSAPCSELHKKSFTTA
ncbi:MAG: hypothetical protein AB7V32_01835 [Candidatus Berkiella sp.]